MQTVYSQKKVIASRFLEVLSFLLLYPLSSRNRKLLAGIKRILLVEPFQMGDVLSLTCLLKPLRKKFPDATIAVLTKTSSGEILRFDSRVNKIYTVDFPWSDHGEKRFSLTRVWRALRYAIRLREEHFDLGIDTRGDIRSQVLLVLAGCKRRLGYQNYIGSNINLKGLLLTHRVLQSPYPHRFERNTYILTALGMNVAELIPVDFPTFVPDHLVQKHIQTNIAVVHVGGGWIYRRWPESKWPELIRRMQGDYERIFVVGGPGERDILDRVAAHFKGSSNIEVCVTSLEELIGLISGCSQFVGLDSGPMNLAVCLNRPVIALFGPGNAAMWKPIHTAGRYVQKVEKFPCSPCLQITCVFPEKNCMHEIEVEDVLRLLDTKNTFTK